MRDSVLLFVMAALCIGAPPALAQDGEEVEDLPINFVFSTQLGSGIYSVAGQTVQVYRIPISIPVRKLNEDRKWGVRARFPVTLGFANFRWQDLIDTGLPDSVETISIVPGVQFQVPLDRHWTLLPYVEGGAGKHFSGGQITWVYSGGVRAEGEFPTGSFTYIVMGEALYAGQYATKTKARDDFVLTRLGFDARHPLWFAMGGGDKATGGLYARSTLYFGHLRFQQPGQKAVEQDKQYEVGFTLGRPKPFKWWWIKIANPRFGLGYRWGREFWAVRLVLGNAF